MSIEDPFFNDGSPEEAPETPARDDLDYDFGKTAMQLLPEPASDNYDEPLEGNKGKNTISYQEQLDAGLKEMISRMDGVINATTEPTKGVNVDGDGSISIRTFSPKQTCYTAGGGLLLEKLKLSRIETVHDDNDTLAPINDDGTRYIIQGDSYSTDKLNFFGRPKKGVQSNHFSATISSRRSPDDALNSVVKLEEIEALSHYDSGIDNHILAQLRRLERIKMVLDALETVAISR